MFHKYINILYIDFLEESRLVRSVLHFHGNFLTLQWKSIYERHVGFLLALDSSQMNYSFSSRLGYQFFYDSTMSIDFLLWIWLQWSYRYMRHQIHLIYVRLTCCWIINLFNGRNKDIVFFYLWKLVICYIQ